MSQTKAPAAPRITHLAWGRVEIAGYTNPFKDAKLFPGGAREWDWAETGTHHSPGIQPEDVEDLLAHGALVVVLARGFEGRLQVTAEALARLEALGVPVHQLPTGQAVQLYNRLRESQPVGALIHSTC